MEHALILHNKHWKEEKYSNIFERPLLNKLIEKLDLKEIQVLLGIRRCGKSSMFRLLINHLIKSENPKSILFINCEDPFFSEIWNDAAKLYRVVELAEKITGVSVKYLFFDEVQVIKDWEKFIKSIYETEKYKKIFITGSNSELLEGDYINMLSGRYVSDIVYPLSFQEILSQHHNINDKFELITENPTVLRILENTLYNGSFPEVFKIKNVSLKREVLLNYYETIVLKDCLINNKIRDVFLFRNLSHYLLSNIATVFSYNSLAKSLNNNENTLKHYISILEKCFIIKELQHFSYSLKSQSKIKKKVFCIDNGLINDISLIFTSNYGKLLENLVYTEILKMGKYEIFFYNENEECDFILKNQKQLIAVQVAYELNAKNEIREYKGIEIVRNKFKISKSYIVTFNQSFEKNNITILPFSHLYNYLNQ